MKKIIDALKKPGLAMCLLSHPASHRSAGNFSTGRRMIMFGMGTIEVAIIGVVAVMLFGGRLPKVARSFGQSIVEFKRGFLEVEKECKEIEHTIEAKVN